jgi:hypothetical protein
MRARPPISKAMPAKNSSVRLLLPVNGSVGCRASCTARTCGDAGAAAAVLAGRTGGSVVGAGMVGGVVVGGVVVGGVVVGGVVVTVDPPLTMGVTVGDGVPQPEHPPPPPPPPA